MTGDHSSKVDSAKRLAELREAAAEPTANDAEEGIEFESEENYKAYSMLSADRQRKVMVEFRLVGGNAKALAYSFLVSMDFDASKGIEMDFTAVKVTIRGRNLRPLFQGLVLQRQAIVSEYDDLQAEANLPEDAVVVTKVEFTPAE